MKDELIKRIISSIVFIPIALLIIIKGSIFFNIFLSCCFMIIFYEWVNMNKKKVYNLLGLIFLLFSFFSIYKLRNYYDDNYFYFLLIFLICISTDLGGYIFGKLFKGPKLTKLSPNKTYAGVIGSYLLSIILVLIFYQLNNEFTLLINLNIYIFTILISTISQLGDILISYFKRLSNIKDTGNIIPGHGGLLDRVDGMIFAFPFSYIILIIYSF